MSRSIAALAAIALLAALLCAGCNQNADKAGDKAAGNQTTGFTEIVPGLSYVDSVIGDGPEVLPDDMVSVHYTGWLYENGEKTTKFDSSLDRGDPITFPLGRSLVIPGWEKGLPGMHVGGKRTLLISPEMAYGEQGHPPVIPPNSTLMFDVQVVAIPHVDVQVTHEGDGPVAELGDQCSVHYTGWLWENGAKGKKFDSSRDRGQPYTFTLGARMVIPGWEQAIEGMKKGTKATLIIPPELAYGSRGHGQTIPPNSTLCFDVELVDIAGK